MKNKYNAEYRKWKTLFEKELSNANLTQNENNNDSQPIFTDRDINSRSIAGQFPGIPPYGRGVRASMYRGKPWTIRQYAGFSTALESNQFFKENLRAGHTGLSVAFDLATHRGYDSDHPRVVGDVGLAGVAIDTIEDMHTLFKAIPLDKMSVSMTMSGAVLPIMAMYIVCAQERGFNLNDLTGTIQNDILKEYLVRNTYIYPPEQSLYICSQIIDYCVKHLPRFNPISVSGYHLHEAGANAAQELAYTIANGLAYVQTGIDVGLDVDQFAPRFSFFFALGINLFKEVAKLRAARILWHEYMQKKYAPNDPRSCQLRIHCQTSGASLTSQGAHNNIIRTTIEAMAGVLGGTQSLHTNSFDEALALPSDFAARIALNTQHILLEESHIGDVIDPLGGSYYVESLTNKMVEDARKLIDEVLANGGMVLAIERGVPQEHIEYEAILRQTKIERGKEVLVGVNRFDLPNENTDYDLRKLDNHKIIASQRLSIGKVLSTRDEFSCQNALAALRIGAKKRQGNLLALAIDAVRARATLGEVSIALKQEYGQYDKQQSYITDVYDEEMVEDTDYKDVTLTLTMFKERHHREPRVLISKMGQDGHDRGAKVIASGLSDIGFDVTMTPLFQMPREIVRQSIEHKVDIIGISSMVAAHNTLIPELMTELVQQGAADIMVVCGGTIPPEDEDKLYDCGVRAVFLPGTKITDAAVKMLNLLNQKNSIGA